MNKKATYYFACLHVRCQANSFTELENETNANNQTAKDMLEHQGCFQERYLAANFLTPFCLTRQNASMVQPIITGRA